MAIMWKEHTWIQPHSADPRQIESLEAIWNIKLPAEYKHILEHHQGMVPEPGVFTLGQEIKVVDLFLTIEPESDLEHYSIAQACEALRVQIPGQILPFALTHGGELLCLDYRNSPEQPTVVFVTAVKSMQAVASNFHLFLEMLHDPKIENIYEHLLRQPPQDVEEWLDTVAIGGLIEGARFNWRLFAFTTARYATETPSLFWARVSLRVYGGLIKDSPKELADSLLYSAMNLRACMIIELGPKAGDPVLDPEIIIAWVKQTMTLSFEEATSWAVSKDFHNTPVDTIRQLRGIKHALGVLKNIMKTRNILLEHPDLDQWLRLRSDLP